MRLRLPLILVCAAASLPAAPLAARQAIAGCLRPEFSAAPRLGDLDPATPLHLSLSLPPRDPAGLDAFIAALYDPKSPEYRHFLSPQTFADRFGPAAQDYRTLQDFARAAGLRVVTTHANRLLLEVQGEASRVERAFHVTLGRRRGSDGGVFYAPDNEPSVDLALNGLRVDGLDNDARWRRLSRRHSGGTGRSVRRPAEGSGAGGAYQGYDFRDAYAPGASLEGSGQVVGLVEFGGFYYSDISAYAATSNPPLPSAFNVQWVPVDGYNGNPVDNGDTGSQGDDCAEVSLDIEMALSMAPQAEVLAFEAPFMESGGYTPTLADVLAAVTDMTACAQVSCSWIGGPMGSDAAQELGSMATEGQAFFQASGDNGAYSQDDAAGPVPEPQSLSPYITVVGGTNLITTNPGGGGPAYSSETVWNDFSGSCSDPNGGSGGASGGGVCDVDDPGDSAVLDIPAYQEGVDLSGTGGSTTYRNIPDVSAIAENFMVVWCDQCPAGDDDGFAGRQSAPFDGTSGASPVWAAFTALVNEQIDSESDTRLGFANPALYALGEGAGYAEDFHDVTAGANDLVDASCDPVYFSALKGYDLCTGWGSPNGAALIHDLAGTIVSPTDTPTGTITPTFSASPTASSTPTATPTFTDSPTLTVSPSATPTPTVTPTFTDSPTPTDSPSVTPTFTASPTPDFLASGLGRTVLAPNPARGGGPVTLYFSSRPARTRWRVFNMAGGLVARADIQGPGPHQVSTGRWASGLYFAQVIVDYADGASRTLFFKIAVIR